MSDGKHLSPLRGSLLALAATALCVQPTLANSSREDDAADRADKAMERAARDAARAEERAERDQDRYTEERIKILEDKADEPFKLQEELAKLEADRVEQLAEAEEDAAKDAAELAEELAKIEEDEIEHAEDYEAYGSSDAMRDIALDEAPEYDPRGFPIRRGEVVALNLPDAGLEKMRGSGFTVIAEHELPSLGSKITRLSAPEGMDARGALSRARDILPQTTFDFTHYYSMQFSASGSGASTPGGTLPQKKGRLTLGMIDTGVVSHPLLRGKSIEIRDFGQGRGGVPTGHGTAVASILVSEGATSLFVANVFRTTQGDPFTSADALVGALEWMVARKVRVVNMSLAGPRNAILDKLIEQASGRGTIIVAAGGNGGPSAPPAYPAALDHVIAVTAVDANRRVYRYANQGRYITVAAHGVDEPAAAIDGGIARFSGTSFATPHVSAWMARCLDKDSPLSCVRKLQREAIDLGEPGHDPVYGHGLIE